MDLPRLSDRMAIGKLCNSLMRRRPVVLLPLSSREFENVRNQ
jgi:hypothetical protein